jgi:hypothetical protein
MDDNIAYLDTTRFSKRCFVSPAQYYQLNFELIASAINEKFLEKAAAFQEIRDCLTAADQHRLSVQETENRIRYFVRAYLNGTI